METPAMANAKTAPNLKPNLNEVWIVGASQGLGLAMAKVVRAQGRTVVGMSRRVVEAPDVFSRYAAIDVRDETCVDQAVAQLYNDGAAPGVILFSAATARQGPLMSFREADLSAEVETNYLGFVRLCRSIARHKPTNQRVRVVAIGSTLGYVGCPSTDNYSATKAALICFARSARVEFAPLGIDLLILSPPHMDNSVDLVGPQPFTVAWAAGRMVAAADRGRREYLLGASNRLMMRMGRYTPDLALGIMNAIGRGALDRAMERAAQKKTGGPAGPPALA
jgi:3-oxoacyl-[acyl-carrier protein] reductase